MTSSNVMIQKRSAFMVKWHLGKPKWYLAIAVAVIAVSVVVLALINNQDTMSKHMYPQDAIHGNSNLHVRGVVTSIEENYKSDGMIDYHIFRFYIRLNITEVVWISEDMGTFKGTTIGIGYDNLDNPQLSIGQIVECKGYFMLAMGSPYVGKITVAPSISESYLEPQG
jgi:hypothetical protein